MTKQKKYVSEGHVIFVNRSFDLTKRWYVQYWVVGKLKPCRVWISQLDTVIGRVGEFEEIKQKLIDGTYTPKVRVFKKEYATDVPSFKILYNTIEQKKGRIKGKTPASYRSHLKGFENFCIESNIIKLNSKVALLFIDSLLQKGRAGTTVNNYRCTLKMIFSSVDSSKNIDKKSFLSISKVPEHVEPRGYFQAHQKEFIKKYLLEKDPKMWQVCKFLYWLCVRPGNELRYVKVGDIDFNLNQIKITSVIAKNNRTEFIKISPQYFSELKQLTKGLDFNSYLFSKNGKLVQLDYWSKRFTKHLKAMQFDKEGKKFSLYSFKNTWTVDAYKKGYHIKDIMRHLRHKNISTTDKYLNSLSLYDAESFDKMNDL